MSAKISRRTVTISFRVTPEDKKKLDFIIKVLNTNKSEYFRKNVNTLLLTLKIKQNDKSI